MYVKRNVFDTLLEDNKFPYVTILLGPRQVGKSTLLLKLKQSLDQNGGKSVYFDLEQPADLTQFNRKDSEIISFLDSLHATIFIDEFQYIKNASRIFKALFDRAQRGESGTKVYATGSSSIEIHKHLKESLAGRKRVYQIYPLTLGELAATHDTFDTYLQYGGMPGLLHEKTTDAKQRLLEEILKSFILKDVRGLLREENIRAFNHMLYFLAEKQGSIISTASLSREIGLGVRAVENYLSILKETFVLHPLPSYSRNQSNELKKSHKYYLYDLGIRNSLLRDFSACGARDDKGAVLETMVLLNLLPLLKPNMSVGFWQTRTGDEVDFIVTKDRQPFPVEVTAEWHAPEITPGLRKFIARYPKTRAAAVVSASSHTPVKERDTVIYFEKLSAVTGLLGKLFANA